ncbi:MAG TPA: Holliday junction resolvase RuvX [Tepidisphaeraceae bacterium]|jgi:putative Holliday junction resolvase
MRTLAIDFGGRRVGLALSDQGGRFASPYEVLFISSPEQAAERILAIIAKEGVERLVVGLPLNMDETMGPAARETIRFARDLAGRAGKPLVFVDERLTSFAAEQQLADRKRAGEKLTHKRKKQQQDAVAACIFLQAFLDGKLLPVDVSR